MGNPRQRDVRALVLTMVLLAVPFGCGAWAMEVQLAGIRLGQHAYDVLRVYGQPDTVILGATGAGSISTGGGAPAAGAAQQTGGMPDAGAFGGGALSEAVGMGMGVPGLGAGPGAPDAMGAAEMPGAAQTPAGAAGAGRFARHRDVPDWAMAVQTSMTTTETMWSYRRKGVALSFILDRDGYVVAILASGPRADWIRTAMAEPKRTVKLGDHYRRVMERYGHPSSTDLHGVGTGFSRDLVLHYGYNNNVSFTLRDMKVHRIYIWESELRGTAPVRLPATMTGPPTVPAGSGVGQGFRR